VAILLCGDLGVDPASLRGLWNLADEIAVTSEDQREFVARSVGLAPGTLVVKRVEPHPRGEVWVPAVDAIGLGGGEVTAPGPEEWPPGTRVRHLSALAERAASRAETRFARVARSVLGRHAGKLGRPLRSVVEPVRKRVSLRARGGVR